MPARVGEPHGIVQHIRITIERLRIGRIRHNRVRLDEAADEGIVPSGIVKVQANGRFMILTGEAFGSEIAEGTVAVVAKGVVVIPGSDRAILVHQHAGGAEMVAQYVFYAVVATMSSATQDDKFFCKSWYYGE